MGNTESSPAGIENELRMVLIGKTGSGKSATGNSLLRKMLFVSASSISSCTKHCRQGENSNATEKKKYNLIVVDTPGLYDTGMTHEDVTKEVIKCIGMTTPGPHVIIYVVPLAARFTQEEEATASHFIDMFGERLMDYMVIIFSHGDSMQQGDSLENRIASAPQSLQNLVKKCGNRYVVFDNKTSSKGKKKKQLKSFMEMVEKMIETNGKSFYTDEMFKEAERVMQKQIEQKIEDETIQPYEARQAVRKDVEEGGGMLSVIGTTLYACAKVMLPPGVSSLLDGLTALFKK